MASKVASMPALNIKNEEAYRLAKELAEIEGENMTTVVIEAMRDRLERKRAPQINEERMQYWLNRGREIRAHLEKVNPEWLEGDPTADLYDEETGLPK